MKFQWSLLLCKNDYACTLEMMMPVAVLFKPFCTQNCSACITYIPTLNTINATQNTKAACFTTLLLLYFTFFSFLIFIVTFHDDNDNFSCTQQQQQQQQQCSAFLKFIVCVTSVISWGCRVYNPISFLFLLH